MLLRSFSASHTQSETAEEEALGTHIKKTSLARPVFCPTLFPGPLAGAGAEAYLRTDGEESKPAQPGSSSCAWGEAGPGGEGEQKSDDAGRAEGYKTSLSRFAVALVVERSTLLLLFLPTIPRCWDTIDIYCTTV